LSYGRMTMNNSLIDGRHRFLVGAVAWLAIVAGLASLATVKAVDLEIVPRDWRERWHVHPKRHWGLANLEVIDDPSGTFPKVFRIRYPRGSASPTVTRDTNAPVGGAQFYATLGLPPRNSLHLRYYVRFAEDFDFVKGGKLPGLFGGTVQSGQ